MWTHQYIITVNSNFKDIHIASGNYLSIMELSNFILLYMYNFKIIYLEMYKNYEHLNGLVPINNISRHVYIAKEDAPPARSQTTPNRE